MAVGPDQTPCNSWSKLTFLVACAMNAAGIQTFRGYRSITEVVERMTALAEWLRTHKPDCKAITLRRRDLDLLQRWPAAAGVHHIFTTNGVTYWRGFELHADKTAPRYVGPFEPAPRP